MMPTDIFGAMAFLLEQSGAYQSVFPVGNSGIASSLVTRSQLEEFSKLGAEWASAGRKLPCANGKRKEKLSKKIKTITDRVQREWEALLGYSSSPVSTELFEPQAWWTSVALLFVFADEASVDLGHRAESGDRSFIDVLMEGFGGTDFAHAYPDVQMLECKNRALTHLYEDRTKRSYAPFLDAEIARVMPKGRTPDVGCTLRTLSHNLAFISDPTALDLAWFVQDRLSPTQFEALNILLVPFPFKIPANSFKARTVNTGKGNKKWGWYEVEQSWLNSGFNIVSLVRPLLEAAERDQGPVHGIVFPEMALDWNAHAELVEFILATWNPSRSECDAIQFIVSGLGESHELDRGNFAYVTSFHLDATNLHWIASSFGRSKHHRWKLTASQLTEYALSGVLDPDADWWEGIQIEKRGMAIHVVRESVSISALICEDLARSDPCHEPLRCLGPTLIIALLMDGAQLPHRWPGRYATGLADDPGSSVLTLSSLGLIERSNNTGRYKENRTVALWKDDRGIAVPLSLPKGASAILISLSASTARESTLDGRLNGDAIALHYQCHQPIF